MEVAVVGGGLGGLVAALDLARGGCAVTLFEKARSLGGRARTTHVDGYSMNMGPHALYRGGAARAALQDHGVTIRGAVPSVNGGYAVRGGIAYTLPVGPLSILTTGLLSLGGRLEVARFFKALPGCDLSAARGLTLAAWAERAIARPDARAFLLAVVRVSTYADDPERQSAEAALRQLRLGQEGVLYLDRGWQPLVDALAERARQAGVRIESAVPVRAVEHGSAVSGVRLADGSLHRASSVLLAVGPSAAAALVPEVPVLARWALEARPVRASSLDVALSRLPRPRARFAIGIDAPLYFSVHSEAARLAPEGGALVHVARYLGSSAPADPREVEAELECLLDRLQPGWRGRVVHRRFLPDLVVAHALHTLAARPSPEGIPLGGLFVAGDWVGEEGMLADASVASGRKAAAAILRRPRWFAAAERARGQRMGV